MLPDPKAIRSDRRLNGAAESLAAMAERLQSQRQRRRIARDRIRQIVDRIGESLHGTDPDAGSDHEADTEAAAHHRLPQRQGR